MKQWYACMSLYILIGLDNGLLHIWHDTIIETNDGSPYISMC